MAFQLITGNRLYQRFLPVNTRRYPFVDLMLGQRRRRWISIKSTLGQCFVCLLTIGVVLYLFNIYTVRVSSRLKRFGEDFLKLGAGSMRTVKCVQVFFGGMGFRVTKFWGIGFPQKGPPVNPERPDLFNLNFQSLKTSID